MLFVIIMIIMTIITIITIITIMTVREAVSLRGIPYGHESSTLYNQDATRAKPSKVQSLST